MEAAVRKHQSGSGWEGIVKSGNDTVWCCGHFHHNRDLNGRHGRSARKCAELYLRDPNNWQENIKRPI